jgi:hypothetical protein
MEETEQSDTKWDGERCHNEEANCHHYTAIHRGGHGMCYGVEQIKEPPYLKKCKCTGVKKVKL